MTQEQINLIKKAVGVGNYKLVRSMWCDDTFVIRKTDDECVLEVYILSEVRSETFKLANDFFYKLINTGDGLYGYTMNTLGVTMYQTLEEWENLLTEIEQSSNYSRFLTSIHLSRTLRRIRADFKNGFLSTEKRLDWRNPLLLRVLEYLEQDAPNVICKSKGMGGIVITTYRLTDVDAQLRDKLTLRFIGRYDKNSITTGMELEIEFNDVIIFDDTLVVGKHDWFDERSKAVMASLRNNAELID